MARQLVDQESRNPAVSDVRTPKELCVSLSTHPALIIVSTQSRSPSSSRWTP